jgi:hypothetical protein
MWNLAADSDLPYVNAAHLVEIKKTNREKDFAVIGELARLLKDPRDQFLCSRSARDLIELTQEHPDLAKELETQRRVLASITRGLDALERALDEERRALMHANETRLRKYMDAAKAWQAAWPEVEREAAGRPLEKAHEILVRRAEGVLPFEP